MRYAFIFVVLGGCGLVLDLDEPIPDAGRDSQAVDAFRPDGETPNPDAPRLDAPMGFDAVASDGLAGDVVVADAGQDANISCIATCMMGQECVAGECRPLCEGTVCPEDAACLPGPGGAVCVRGCAGVECAAGEVCTPGGHCECTTALCPGGICSPDGMCLTACGDDFDCLPNLRGESCDYYACDDGACARQPRSDYSPSCDECNVLSGSWRPTDLDGDGFPSCSAECERANIDMCDCDDEDPTTYPGAVEFLDEADQNCDGRPRALSVVCALDFDRDGYPVFTSAVTTLGCRAMGGIPVLRITPDTRRQDCDDGNPAINPGVAVFMLEAAGDSCDGFGCGYDWNCDGWEEREHPSYQRCRFAETEAQCNGGLFSGWETDDRVARCGESRNFVECSWTGTACFEHPAINEQQRCR